MLNYPREFIAIHLVPIPITMNVLVVFFTESIMLEMILKWYEDKKKWKKYIKQQVTKFLFSTTIILQIFVAFYLYKL